MMTKEVFWEWFKGEVCGRWPRCVFTAAQLRDWYRQLAAFEPAVLTEAICRHAVGDEPRRPSLKAVTGHARRLTTGGSTASPNKQKPSRGVPEANTYIQCVGPDETGGGPVGMFVPILIWPFGDHHSPEAIRRTADHQAARHQRCYGGRWEPIVGTTHAAMLKRRTDLDRGTIVTDT